MFSVFSFCGRWLFYNLCSGARELPMTIQTGVKAESATCQSLMNSAFCCCVVCFSPPFLLQNLSVLFQFRNVLAGRLNHVKKTMLVVFCLINRNITTFCAHMLRRPFCRHRGKESNAPAVSFRQFIKCPSSYLLACNGYSCKRFIYNFFNMWDLIVIIKIYTVYNLFLDFDNVKS